MRFPVLDIKVMIKSSIFFSDRGNKPFWGKESHSLLFIWGFNPSFNFNSSKIFFCVSLFEFIPIYFHLFLSYSCFKFQYSFNPFHFPLPQEPKISLKHDLTRFIKYLTVSSSILFISFTPGCDSIKLKILLNLPNQFCKLILYQNQKQKK